MEHIVFYIVRIVKEDCFTKYVSTEQRWTTWIFLPMRLLASAVNCLLKSISSGVSGNLPSICHAYLCAGILFLLFIATMTLPFLTMLSVISALVYGVFSHDVFTVFLRSIIISSFFYFGVLLCIPAFFYSLNSILLILCYVCSCLSPSSGCPQPENEGLEPQIGVESANGSSNANENR